MATLASPAQEITTYLKNLAHEFRFICDEFKIAGVGFLKMSMDEQSDQELVVAALQGNSSAFELLVRRYQDAVFGLAMSMTRNYADAADMAQDALVKAYSKLEQYNAEYSFKSWLLRICANQTKNLFRKRTNQKKVEENFHMEKTSREMDDEHDYSELEAALNRLPTKLSVPLRLKYIEGMGYDEVATVLKIGVSAAKMRVMRARNQLAEMLNYEKA